MLSDELLHRIRLRAEDAQTRTDLLYNVDLGSKLIARATQNQVSAAESELGFQLPRDLVDLYLGVANGGFGPGCGIIGLFGGWTDDQGATLVSLYLDRIQRRKRKDPDWRWPERLVPFCYLGCASYSCIDCNSESARVVAADSEIEEWPEESSNLRDWIAAWAAGEDMGERYRAVVSPFYPA